MKKVILNSSGKPYLDNGKPIMVDIPSGSGEPTIPSQDSTKSTLTINYGCTYVIWTGSSDEYSDGVHITECESGMTINPIANSLVLLLGNSESAPECLYEVELEENGNAPFFPQYYSDEVTEDIAFCYPVIAPNAGEEGEIDG